MQLQISFRMGFASGSISSSSWVAMRIPVNTRNAPKTYMIQWNCSIRSHPAAIIAPRRARAPKMPQNRTRCWYFAGTRK